MRLFSRLLGPRKAKQSINGLVPVEALLQGDIVDLKLDKYASIDNEDDTFQTVVSVKREAPEVTLVTFAGADAVGFPVGHEVLVVSEAVNKIAGRIQVANPQFPPLEAQKVAFKTLRLHPRYLNG